LTSPPVLEFPAPGLDVAFEDAGRDTVGFVFDDLIEEAALPEAEAILLDSIGGRLSSTIQLHYLDISSRTRSRDDFPYPEEFPKGRVVWFTWLALHIFEILGKPKP
jgi:hypothetical protein